MFVKILFSCCINVTFNQLSFFTNIRIFSVFNPIYFYHFIIKRIFFLRRAAKLEAHIQNQYFMQETYKN